jgi:hypothetical protein
MGPLLSDRRLLIEFDTQSIGELSNLLPVKGNCSTRTRAGSLIHVFKLPFLSIESGS